MNPEKTYVPLKNRIHPLVAGASVAVIIAAGVAVAAITGVMPGTSAKQAEQGPLSSAAGPAAAPASAQPQKSAPPARVASSAVSTQQKAKCASCGTVLEIKEVEVRPQTSGGGALAGAAAGGLIGHEVVGERNQGIGTVIGAVGGALAGNEIEKRAKTHKRYDVAVRMEDGSTRTVSSNTQPSWRKGDHVRVAEGKLELVK